MADIVFKCTGCGKPFGFPGEYVGRTLMCPECEKEVTIPTPRLRFTCASCKAEIGAPRDMAGEKVPCPACLKPVAVPAEPASADASIVRVVCHACEASFRVDAVRYRELAGTIINCLKCNAELTLAPMPEAMSAPAIPAPQKGTVRIPLAAAAGTDDPLKATERTPEPVATPAQKPTLRVALAGEKPAAATVPTAPTSTGAGTPVPAPAPTSDTARKSGLRLARTAKRQCVHCSVEIGTEDLICTSCGTNQATGERPTVKKEGGGLRGLFSLGKK